MATVVITSTGGVTKRVFALGELVDRGLVTWAGEYSWVATPACAAARRITPRAWLRMIAERTFFP